MASDERDYPEKGEFILGTVKSIFKQGAFITLDEYGKKEGMLHLSEISLKWVRNIRDYVKEGQKVVLVVLRVNPERGHIDLSLRRVKDQQRKEKLKEIKQAQRSKKLLEQLAEALSLPEEEVNEKVTAAALLEFESVYSALEAIAGDEKALNSLKIEKVWKKPFLELVKRNIKAPFVEILGYIELKSYDPNGISAIKSTLKKIENYPKDKKEDESVEITVSYISAPAYRIKIKAKDYKIAEKLLKDSSEEAIAYIKKKNGEGEFYRTLDEAKQQQP